jgi:hypothetical protein
MLAKLKIYAIIGLINLIVIGGMTGFGFYKGHGAGADSVQTKWNAAKAEGTKQKINTKVKQDEIQSAPVDVRVTNRRMFNKSY